MEHPRSPIVEGNADAARPAGRIFVQDGRLVRFAQGCGRRYGKEVNAFEVTTISRTDYRERRLSQNPILKDAGPLALGSRWNRHGMHYLDAHQVDETRWVACVDGYCKYLSIHCEY